MYADEKEARRLEMKVAGMMKSRISMECLLNGWDSIEIYIDKEVEEDGYLTWEHRGRTFCPHAFAHEYVNNAEANNLGEECPPMMKPFEGVCAFALVGRKLTVEDGRKEKRITDWIRFDKFTEWIERIEPNGHHEVVELDDRSLGFFRKTGVDYAHAFEVSIGFGDGSGYCSYYDNWEEALGKHLYHGEGEDAISSIAIYQRIGYYGSK